MDQKPCASVGKPTNEDGARCQFPQQKYFDHARELPRVKELFDELESSKEAAKGKNEEPMLRVEMNVDADYYSFN